MKIGDHVRFNDNKGEPIETLWKIVGFEVRGDKEFVLIQSPNVGGVFSFLKQDVVEVIDENTEMD